MSQCSSPRPIDRHRLTAVTDRAIALRAALLLVLVLLITGGGAG